MNRPHFSTPCKLRLRSKNNNNKEDFEIHSYSMNEKYDAVSIAFALSPAGKQLFMLSILSKMLDLELLSHRIFSLYPIKNSCFRSCKEY